MDECTVALTSQCQRCSRIRRVSQLICEPSVFAHRSTTRERTAVDRSPSAPLQPSYDASLPANVFGVELHQLVEKEGSGVPIPLLIQKCVAEIERRGLRVRRCSSQPAPAWVSTNTGVIVVFCGRWLDSTDCVALQPSRRSSGIGSRGTAPPSASARTSTPTSTSLQVRAEWSGLLHDFCPVFYLSKVCIHCRQKQSPCVKVCILKKVLIL